VRTSWFPLGRANFWRSYSSGDFGINNGHFGNPQNQSNIDRLSARATGGKDQDAGRVLSDLKGHVVLRNGNAMLSNLTFQVPGAIAYLDGAENLITKEVNLRGKLVTEGSLSHDAGGGFKSFLLKPLDPFFKKHHHGAEIPISVTGPYPNPTYRFSLH